MIASPYEQSTSSGFALRIERLSKLYRLGTINHGTLAKDLQSFWARMRGREDPNLRLDQAGISLTGRDADRFWALRDVSFDVKRGEVLGIIGRNGAGKSTLLKILSRVTAPSSGQVKVSGRIASLLEVGTGFHPELTGRENIFLNGAILGMSRQEIQARFDEIVQFSEVGKFLNTPVKRYSSGMYVRLAFAVAAHLDSEVLIVDEVLAVGDAQFQKKCLGKMAEVGKDGRTVLFVSHNLTAIRNLCEKAIWLEGGRIKGIGSSSEMSENYLRQNLRGESLSNVQDIIDSLPADPAFRLESILVKQGNEVCTKVLNGAPVDVEIRYRVLRKTRGLRVYFDLCDEEKNILFRTFNDDNADSISIVDEGSYLSRAKIPADLLAPRTYELRVFGTIYNIRNVPVGGVGLPLTVEKSNDVNRGYPHDPIRGKLLPRIFWETNPL